MGSSFAEKFGRRELYTERRSALLVPWIFLSKSVLTSGRLFFNIRSGPRDFSTTMQTRKRPGEVRDAIVKVLEARPRGATIGEITGQVTALIGAVPASSVRSYLQLNTPALFARTDRAQYVLNGFSYQPAKTVRKSDPRSFTFGKAILIQDECLAWLERQPTNSVHAVVTDPPYGLVEYSEIEQRKLRAGRGGIWRIPPSFDGSKRSPLPRFTVLKQTDLDALEQFFTAWAARLLPVLVPGANVVVASNPLLSYI